MAFKLYGALLRQLISADLQAVWDLADSMVFYRPPASTPSGDHAVIETLYDISNETGVTAEIKYQVMVYGIFQWPGDPNNRIEDYLEAKVEAFIDRFCALPHYGPENDFGFPFVAKVIFSTPADEHPGRRRAVVTMVCTCDGSFEDDRRA